MSVRTPNPEQQKAIEHFGGVLLAAGAGSGKTFVLVEHIVYLITKFFEKNDTLNEIDLQRELKNYLGSIVLMTFTKKAAGELTLRLRARVAGMSEENGKRWEIAKECVSSMTVGTIHGFCFKLLSQGFFTDFDPSVKMLSDVEFGAKIEKLVENFENSEFPNGLMKQNDIVKSIFANRKSLIETFISIFSNPELRVMWGETAEKDSSSFEFKKYLDEVVEILGVKEFVCDEFPILDYADYSKNKWYEFIVQTESFKKELALNSFEDLTKWHDYFSEIKKLPSAPVRTSPELVIEYLTQLKDWRKLLKDNIDSFVALKEEGKSVFDGWLGFLKNIFNFIELNYGQVPGLTFSDLEYLVLKGLKNPESQKRISEHYKYLIVDEFQDTSTIQFEIIEKIIEKDFSRFFCVGDLKQAIYGFRGGELGVFLDCMELVSQNLSLKNNYRSLKNIISFNNLLFENIFKKGESYQGIDKNSVEVELQEYPFDDCTGILSKNNIQLTLPEGEKLRMTPAILDRMESLAIVDILKKNLEENPSQTNCILYRKLTPTRHLMPLLIDQDISFTAQVKVPVGEDPVVGLFHLLLEGLMHKNVSGLGKNDSFITSMISTYLNILNMACPDSLESLVEQFYKDVNTYGVVHGFQKFLFSSNISNSNFSNNMKIIENICNTSRDLLDDVWVKFNSHFGDRYSIDFQYGNNPSQIVIMTAHASKGLEFDHVILGGIHTNGVDKGLDTFIGGLPGSFLWKDTVVQKKFHKSPTYILENLYKKKKEFSESKRLFYVACTRAKEKLSWVDLNKDGKPSSHSKNSWINGIRSWENDMDKTSLQIRELILDASRENEMNLLEEVSESPELPLFHKDNLGLVSKEDDSSEVLAVIPEMSVTKLAMISDCPRKFYLKNICKLEGDEFERDENDLVKESKELTENEEVVWDVPEVKASSAVRGTMIHAKISEMILGNWTMPVDTINQKEVGIFKWVKEIFTPFVDKNYQFISEVPLKFSVFGHMISGTPDLILLPCDSEGVAEVWDFKTGQYTEEKSRPYWFQLKSYAYAIKKLYPNINIRQIRLVLCFVDEEIVIDKFLTTEEITHDMSLEWEKLGHLDQVNDAYCPKCSFGNLCHLN